MSSNNILDKVKQILAKEGLLDRRQSLEQRLALAIKNPLVRETFEFSTPRIDDITDYLPLKKGRVYAVRMDLTPNVDNHKKQVAGALILRGILSHRIPSPHIDTIIDGGSYSSASALKYYVEKFGMQGIYVMSRLCPEDILSLLRSDRFSIIQAPANPTLPREREFYSFLYDQMTDKDFSKNKFCLWHPKYGGKVSYPLGKELAQKVPTEIQYVVSCLGAGTTLEGTQIPIQDHFIQTHLPQPKIVIAEHELSPLFAQQYSDRRVLLPTLDFDSFIDDHRFFAGVPHNILGPHYDEINPLLAQSSIDRIDSVIQYSDDDWKSTQHYLSLRGLSVGNSSAANVNVAARLVHQGNHVLTVIFEPFRAFYKKHII